EPEPEPVAVTQVERAFSWPSTVANMADGDLPESQWPQMGMLKAVGYSVGANGLMTASRQRLLKHVYMQVLPYIESKSYVAEWGDPKSGSRLKKMAETLAAFARNAKRQKIDKSIAISEWEQDLAWLKDEYYLKHKYTWVWPIIKNKNEQVPDNPKKKVVTLLPKTYVSSREFLEEQYTNKAGELCCQVCQSALPFKLENGKYFWEETAITEHLVPSTFSDLVLCPNHRAMYQHANTSKLQVVDAIHLGERKELSIKLANTSLKLFITEEHANQLLPAIETIKSNSSVYENVGKGLFGVKHVYLYEDQGEWLLTSKKHNVLATFKEKSEAKQWLVGFDEYRGVISTITEKVPTPKSKKTKQPKLKVRTSLSVAAVRFGTVKKTEPQSSYKSGYSLCTTCNGDGGINGGCWKCGGSGWM
ncbi:hypothetical protein AB4519_02385, partial [Vibrio splendidus]